MNANSDKLKLVILTGSDSASTCTAIALLANLPQTQIMAILLEAETPPWSWRWLNLRRNIRREGFAYVYFRFREALQNFLNGVAARLVSSCEVNALLRQAFPERVCNLRDLSAKYHIPIYNTGNLNHERAASMLRRLAPDLGVLLGTRILQPSTFSVPRLGCLNLHKGKVPAYRGMPPGFWELYDGQKTAGVTVHFVDAGLDTGDIIGEDEVDIHSHDTPQTLKKKLDHCGNELLTRCVTDLANGVAVRRPQPPSLHKPRTSPTRQQRRELKAQLRLSTPAPDSWAKILKTFFYLVIFYARIFHVVRLVRQRRGTRRACILLYHRVNDLDESNLTTSVMRFAEHMLTLKKYYTVLTNAQLVAQIQNDAQLPHHAVLIHFDDCYQDVYTQAAQILAQLGFPACCFLSSGFVGTARAFPHDLKKSAFTFANLQPAEIIALTQSGFEVGAHTVNHVDLGDCAEETAAAEILGSKQDLETLLGAPLKWFSYPYGGKANIRPRVVELVRAAKFEAMFSAYGGYVNGSANFFDLPRVGIDSEFRPLDLLMEIEGLSLGAFKRYWHRIR